MSKDGIRIVDVDAAMHSLVKIGVMVDYRQDRPDAYFVGMGSHGGSAPTLRKAMKRCLACCKIGKFWKVGHGTGRLASEVFPEIAEMYLGGWKP